jgi:dTDP-4-dehydrorhamnose reductase
MKPTILLTGKNGQVGRELSRMLPRLGHVIALDRAQLDLASPDDVRSAVRSACPQLIVNAAAYTTVDRAESDQAAAQAVNAEALCILAEEAKKLGTMIVHYSTDYVFDGAKKSPYLEDDLTNPQNAYGRTKLAGEEAIRNSAVPHLIFRTEWVYATEGHNFLLTILRLATQREELCVVRDQIGAPTWSREIAAATMRVLDQLYGTQASKQSVSDVSGTYHMTAAGETSWCDFAEAILAAVSSDQARGEWLTRVTNNLPIIAKKVVPITTQEYPTPARRPAYSVLSNEKLARVFGVRLPTWQEQLHAALSGGESPLA